VRSAGTLRKGITGAAFAPPGRQEMPMAVRAIRVIGEDGGGFGDFSGRKTVVTAALRAVNVTVES